MLAIGDFLHPYQEEVLGALGNVLFSHHVLADQSCRSPGDTGEFSNPCLIPLGGRPRRRIFEVPAETRLCCSSGRWHRLGDHCVLWTLQPPR